jgi:peptide/nickel transport system substrate-binding protein
MQSALRGFLLLSLLLITTLGIVGIAVGQQRIPFDGLKLRYFSETTQTVQERTGIYASWSTTLLFHNVSDTSSVMDIVVNGTVTQSNQQQPEKFNRTVNFPTDRDTLIFLRNGGQDNLTIYAGPSGVAIPALPGLTIDLTRSWNLHDKPLIRTPLGAFSSYRYHTAIKSIAIPTGGALDLDFYAAYEMNTQVLIAGEVWATINGSSAMIARTEIREANLFSTQGPSRCLIATATYGSELAPQVQFLRDFRDEKIDKTFAGASFMIAFNTWYYIFSPSVASEVHANPALQAVMQAILYPLLLILRVSAALFDAFSVQPEFAVLIAGLAASGMIGIFYLWAPTLLLHRRYRGGVNRLLRPLLITFGVGLVGLALAGIIANSILAIFSSATIVAANLVLCASLPCFLSDRTLRWRKRSVR